MTHTVNPKNVTLIKKRTKFYATCTHFVCTTPHKKWSWNAENLGFGRIYWRNPQWKNSFFVQCEILFFISVWHFLDFFSAGLFFFLPEALQTKKNLERGKEQESSNNCGSHSKFIVADINKFINSLYNY